MVIYHIFYLIILYVDKCHNALLPYGRHILCWASTNVGESLPLLYPFLDEEDTYGINVIRNFGVFTE